MSVMSWPHYNPSLQGLPYRKGPFSHHPSVSEAVTLHINGPNGRTTGTKRSSSSLFTLLMRLCLLFFISKPTSCSHFLSIVFFSVLSQLSINHLSFHCDVPRPHWGSLWCELASSWFSCSVILMYVSASVNRTQFGHSEFSSPLKTFILFSCKRMELNQCITDFSFSGQAHCFIWPQHLKSVETGPFLWL